MLASKPLANSGKYYVVNKDTTSNGAPLAISFNGFDTQLTVTEFEGLITQEWNLQEFLGTKLHRISPVDIQGVIAHSGDNRTLVAAHGVLEGENNWHVKGNFAAYIIRDGTLRWFWAIEKLDVGEPVVLVDTIISKHPYWKLVPAVEATLDQI